MKSQQKTETDLFRIIIIVLIITPFFSPSSAEPTDETYKELVLMAIETYNNGDPGSATDMLTSVIMTDPENFLGYWARGNVYYYNKQFNFAIDDFNYALEYSPDDAYLRANIIFLKGKALSKLGRHAEANACFDEAELLSPYFKVPLTERYPFNIIISNIPLIIGIAGIGGIIIVFVYKEILSRPI